MRTRICFNILVQGCYNVSVEHYFYNVSLDFNQSIKIQLKSSELFPSYIQTPFWTLWNNKGKLMWWVLNRQKSFHFSKKWTLVLGKFEIYQSLLKYLQFLTLSVLKHTYDAPAPASWAKDFVGCICQAMTCSELTMTKLGIDIKIEVTFRTIKSQTLKFLMKMGIWNRVAIYFWNT